MFKLFLLFYVFCILVSDLGLIVQAIVARLIGAEIESVGFCMGPVAARFRVGGIPFEWRAVPFPGGSVKLRGEEEDEARAEPTSLDMPSHELGTRWVDLGRWSRILIIATGCYASVVIAMVCLGPLHGLTSVYHGFRQILIGAVSPMPVRDSLVRSMFDLLRNQPFPVAFGVIAAKNAAFNLMPLPPLSGGGILFELFRTRSSIYQRIWEYSAFVGVVGSLLLSVLWGVSIVRVLFGF
ncbi:site-2 protease family protein [Singulisphaera rosea]